LKLLATSAELRSAESAVKHGASDSILTAPASPSPLPRAKPREKQHYSPERAGVRGEIGAGHSRHPAIGGESAPPILFLEPSCWSMFVEDYRELRLSGAEAVAARCLLFEQFIDDLLVREPDALLFAPGSSDIAIHAHCHAKSLANPSFMAR